jgi:hypothetical protein
MHNNVGLNRPDTSLDRGTELGRTSHAVLHRQHCPANPSRIRQSARDGLYGAGRRRSLVPRGYASATGNRAPVRVADCSAGRSACPWPRHFSLMRLAAANNPHTPGMWIDTKAVGKLCFPLVAGASTGVSLDCSVPGSRPCRRRSGDCSRVLTCLRWVKPRVSWSPRDHLLWYCGLTSPATSTITKALPKYRKTVGTPR